MTLRRALANDTNNDSNESSRSSSSTNNTTPYGNERVGELENRPDRYSLPVVVERGSDPLPSSPSSALLTSQEA